MKKKNQRGPPRKNVSWKREATAGYHARTYKISIKKKSPASTEEVRGERSGWGGGWWVVRVFRGFGSVRTEDRRDVIPRHIEKRPTITWTRQNDANSCSDDPTKERFLGVTRVPQGDKGVEATVLLAVQGEEKYTDTPKKL